MANCSFSPFCEVSLFAWVYGGGHVKVPIKARGRNQELDCLELEFQAVMGFQMWCREQTLNLCPISICSWLISQPSSPCSLPISYTRVLTLQASTIVVYLQIHAHLWKRVLPAYWENVSWSSSTKETRSMGLHGLTKLFQLKTQGHCLCFHKIGFIFFLLKIQF